MLTSITNDFSLADKLAHLLSLTKGDTNVFWYLSSLPDSRVVSGWFIIVYSEFKFSSDHYPFKLGCFLFA
jgi:hypothetical protein